MMGRRKSYSECHEKRAPLEAPIVDLQEEGVQSATQDILVMLVQMGYSGYLTMPLKDATIPVWCMSVSLRGY